MMIYYCCITEHMPYLTQLKMFTTINDVPADARSLQTVQVVQYMLTVESLYLPKNVHQKHWFGKSNSMRSPNGLNTLLFECKDF